MDDLTLFDTLREDLAQGGRAVLCTVVDSRGSAPRGAGARMALRPDGSALGTIGGGSAERLAMERAKKLLVETSMLTREVAEEIGSNEVGIIRLFKKYEGCTPGEYRQRYSGQGTP